MSAAKKISSFVKSEHVCDIIKTENNDAVKSAGRNEQQQQRYLLLSTTYGLNLSHTKKIHVGLQVTNEGCYVPIVKLTGNYVDGICFDTVTWHQFQTCMSQMRLYFDENQKTRPSPIIINNISVNFTSAYGSKAVLVSYRENTEHSTDSGRETEEEEDQTQPPLKKRKTYSVAVVMQRATFLGLENIAKCVDAHLSHLISIVDTVNKCVKYIISEIELKLPTSYIDCEIIKLTIKGNYQEIERNVQTQINNLSFLDVHFNIVFVELLSLQFNEITRTILLKRNF